MNNTDCYFEIGSTHNVCEDYVVVGKDRAFLSDGCSTGKYTDVGARLICHTALSMRDEFINKPERVLYEVNAARRVLLLPKECTRATLLSALCRRKGFDDYHVSVMGDGAVVAVKHCGIIEIHNIEYPSGAPCYPSYLTNQDEHKAYLDEFGGERYVEVSEYDETGILLESALQDQNYYTGPYERFFDYGRYKFVLLLSDGVSSFVRQNDAGIKESVPLIDIALQLVAIKSFKGEFIKRRAKRFLKEAAKKGWEHYDDFSVAALYHEDGNDNI